MNVNTVLTFGLYTYLAAYLALIGLETNGAFHGAATPGDLFLGAPIPWLAAVLALRTGAVSWAGATIERIKNPVSFGIMVGCLVLLGGIFATFGTYDALR